MVIPFFFSILAEHRPAASTDKATELVQHPCFFFFHQDNYFHESHMDFLSRNMIPKNVLNCPDGPKLSLLRPLSVLAVLVSDSPDGLGARCSLTAVMITSINEEIVLRISYCYVTVFAKGEVCLPKKKISSICYLDPL